MQGENCGQIGHRRLGGRIPIPHDRALCSQHVELGLARSGKVGVHESGLRSGRESDGDLCVVGIGCMHPYALLVLTTDVRNLLGDHGENLVDEVAAPVEDRPARHLGIRMPIGARFGIATHEAVVLKDVADCAFGDESGHGDEVPVVPAVLRHHEEQLLRAGKLHQFVALLGSQRHRLFQHDVHIAGQCFLGP